ncbi:MAG: hypothetical protein ACI4TJ_01940, partial [Candidatus Cryptobacteroides sp.]
MENAVPLIIFSGIKFSGCKVIQRIQKKKKKIEDLSRKCLVGANYGIEGRKDSLSLQSNVEMPM